MPNTPRIVFIHGLGGHPPKDQYLRQWIAATKLEVGVDLPDRAFSMAYWADLRGEVAETDGEQEIIRGMSGAQRRVLARTGSSRVRYLSWWQRILGRLFKIADPLFQQFLDRYIDDVYTYFYREGKREQIRAVLENALREAQQGDTKVALLSHSMGTVIALDVLKSWEKPVDLFVTMGSPLGLEWIKHKLGAPRFPEQVGHWLNVFDRADPVSLADQRLADDYTRNANLVRDIRVRDNYSNNGERDPHHWHGYLSSPEVASAVKAFWTATNSPPPTPAPVGDPQEA